MENSKLVDIIQIQSQSQPEKKSSFSLHDPVETRGFGGSWHSGYWILRVEPKNFYIVSRLYHGSHNITQLAYPSRIRGTDLRPQENAKLKVTGGIYNTADFLKQHGAFVLRAFDRYED